MRYHKYCSKECAVAAKAAGSGRSKNVPAANVVTDNMLEELFTAAIGNSNVDAAGRSSLLVVLTMGQAEQAARSRAGAMSRESKFYDVTPEA